MILRTETSPLPVPLSRSMRLQRASVNYRYRIGWRHDTIRAGDNVTHVVHALKTDGPAGSLVRITSVNEKAFRLEAIGHVAGRVRILEAHWALRRTGAGLRRESSGDTGSSVQ